MAERSRDGAERGVSTTVLGAWAVESSETSETPKTAGLDETTEQIAVAGPADATERIAAAGVEPGVATRHYTRSALLSALLDALAAAGKPVSPLDSDDLAPLDELHGGGRPATVELAELLAPPPGGHVLDMGAGLGGPARYLARHRGCRVTGVDLARETVEVATELTERCGLADTVRFREGGVTELPFADASFDAAIMLHVGMNVSDKAALCAEAFRVLRPGGRFALYDVMLTVEDGEPNFPLPWANSADRSFLESPAEYRWLLTEAGFTVEEDRDLRDLVLAQLTKVRELGDALPPLGPWVAIGDSYRAKAENLTDALERDLLAPYQLLAVR
nr:class I SAM-dependent methyltransferase [Pseudonocardia acaciae]